MTAPVEAFKQAILSERETNTLVPSTAAHPGPESNSIGSSHRIRPPSETA